MQLSAVRTEEAGHNAVRGQTALTAPRSHRASSGARLQGRALASWAQPGPTGGPRTALGSRHPRGPRGLQSAFCSWWGPSGKKLTENRNPRCMGRHGGWGAWGRTGPHRAAPGRTRPHGDWHGARPKINPGGVPPTRCPLNSVLTPPHRTWWLSWVYKAVFV